MNNPMRIPLIPWRRTVAFIIIVVSFVIATGALTAMTLSKKATPGVYQDSSHLAVYTKPIPLLKPHTHRKKGEVASVLLHGVLAKSDVYIVPKNLVITGVRVQVLNAPATVVHHASLFRLDQPNQTCWHTALYQHYPRELLTVGSETPLLYTHVSFPQPYGIVLPKGTPIRVSAMLHNPKPPYGPGGIHKDVSVGFALDVVQEETEGQYSPLEFYRLHLEEKPCQTIDWTFSVPSGNRPFIKSSPTKGRINPSVHTFKDAGTIVYMGAHLHPWDGGKKIEVFLNGQPIKGFTSALASHEPWSWITPFEGPFSLSVQRGDVISFSAVYENPYNETIQDAMGMIGFYFALQDK